LAGIPNKKKLKHEILFARGELYTLRMTTNYDDWPKGAQDRITQSEKAMSRALAILEEVK
jgi:hypothetical protein